MYYLIFFASWMAGLFVFSFTIVPILIIFFFSIPHSISLNRQGKLKSLVPIRNNLISAILLALIFAIILWLIIRYLPTSVLYGFLIGSSVSFLFSLGKLGSNPNNMSDYMDSNKEYLKD